MIHEHKFWVLDKVIPEHVCDQIVKCGLNHNIEIALTSDKSLEEHKESNLAHLLNYRNSNVAWLNESWIYKHTEAVLNAANKNAGWNYDWDHQESAQFTKYNIGQYYHWHVDSLDKPFNTPHNLAMHKKIRKLSMSLLLSHPDEYEGGDFEFDFSNIEQGKAKHTLKELNGKGSIVVFPSHTYHRVTPVTKGTRYSLVIWCLGDSFR